MNAAAGGARTRHMAEATSGISLLEILLARCRVEPETRRAAEAEAREKGARLENVLVARGLIPPPDMALALAEYLNLRALALGGFTPGKEMIELLPKATLTGLNVAPIMKLGKQLTLAMADPFNLVAIENVQQTTQLEVLPVVATAKDIGELIQRMTSEPAHGLEDILKDVAEGDVELGKNVEQSNLEDALDGAEEAPVIRIVNSIMIEALRKRVSDIHIEPMEKSLRLRYRMDGELYENPSPPKHLQNAIASRIKIMSNLNIAERRIPQDGRFKIRALSKEVDVRVSILPTVHGEKIVMRILDKANLVPGLSHLGLDPSSYENFHFAIEQPHGIIFVTGPTGSGKTTTLYSCLQDLNQADVNIITVEDPVEYQLPGINQVQTHAEVGLSFAAALRSILRQDPDIVMIGETRDHETASIAVQAALTGHLVLSTLHTNDAAGVISRLIFMGVEPFMIASSLIMAQAQRLYRKLCPACKTPIALPEETLRLNHLDAEHFAGVQFFGPRGCPKCNNTGYKGRGSVMEIMLMNDGLRDALLRGASTDVIRETAIKNGMHTLKQVGLDRVREGITSIEEILRVTGGD